MAASPAHMSSLLHQVLSHAHHYTMSTPGEGVYAITASSLAMTRAFALRI